MTSSRFRITALLAVALGAGSVLPAASQELDYYTGLYEAVGRDASKTPKLLNFMVRLEPEDDVLRVQTCGADDGEMKRERGEVGDSMVGTIAGSQYFCRVYNNGDNYAHLACNGELGELLTLWPTMEPSETPLDCGS